MTDNLSLSKARREAYERSCTHGSVFYKRFVLGLWVAADGLIYQQFADNVNDYLVTYKWLDENEIIYATIGVDF